MKNLHDTATMAGMKARVEKLDYRSAALWGTFDAHGVICHLQDTFKYSLGINEAAAELEKGPPMFLRHLIRLYVPIPKGKVQTSPVFLAAKPGDWDKDKAQLLELMDKFLAAREQEAWPMHPFFGDLDGLAWARVMWRHLDHHLRQFSV